MVSRPRIMIMRAPGTNCDRETAHAFDEAGGQSRLVHINELISNGLKITDFQILVFPGGFTYGDDLGAGKIMGNEIRLQLQADIADFAGQGGLMLGICNGFQVMVKAGILPGNGQKVTLTTNDSGRFECRWIHMKVTTGSSCVFTRGIERLYLPVANGEGKVVAGKEALDNLNVAVSYCDGSGRQPAGYPNNPSGSSRDIAGISDDTGRIFALMPHPERYIRSSQHPRWTRGEASVSGEGFKVFTNAVEWARSI